MIRSLFSGVTGLDTSTLRMDVVGNNVANVNTLGYKRSRIVFQEAVNQLLLGANAPSEKLGGSNPTQIGTGSRISSIDHIFSQGNLELTGIETDLAIQGRAFFILSDGGTQKYSRVGAFQLDGAGRLVEPNSRFLVQGFAYDRASAQFSGQLGAITVPIGDTEPAQATGEISYRGNLDADSEPAGTLGQSSIFHGPDGALATEDLALTDLRADANGIVTLLEDGDQISFSATVGDTEVSGQVDVSGTFGDLLASIEASLNADGGVSGITVEVGEDGRIRLASPDILGKSAEVAGLTIQALDAQGVPRNEFNTLAGIIETRAARDPGTFTEETVIFDSLGFSHVVRLTFERVLNANQFTWNAEVDEGRTPILVGSSGRVSFNNDGSLSGFSFDAVNNALPTRMEMAPTTGARTLLSLQLDPGTNGGFDGMTMLRAENTLEATQDGFTEGKLADFRIDREGTVVSRFSNGVSRPVGRIALAEFVNPVGLEVSGGNLFDSTLNSGEALVGSAGAAVQSEIFSGNLEQSNVDLAREFTNMILAQRGFQASARVITTSDEVLSELLNLKR